MAAMIVPWRQIDPETLGNLLEEYVTRDGTDYGEHEVPLGARVEQVRRMLEKGDAVIWFDDVLETVNIVSRQEVQGYEAPDED